MVIGREMGKKVKIVYIPKNLAYGLGFIMEFLNEIFPFYPFRSREIGSPVFSRKTVDWVTNDRYICSINKIKKELGFKPKYTQKEGIHNTLKWYKEKNLI